MHPLRVEPRRLSTGKTVAWVAGLREHYAADVDWESRALARVDSRIAGLRQLAAFLMLHGFRPGGHLLEVGTGAGFDTRVLAAATRSTIVSIDIVQPFAAGAATPAAHPAVHHRLDAWSDNGFRIPSFRDASRFRLLRMDGRALGFAPGTFDAVLYKATLKVVPEMERAVAEALAVLRPGGLLLVVDAPFSGFFGLYRGGVTDVPWAHLYVNEAEYREILPATPVAHTRALSKWRIVHRFERETLCAAVGDRGDLVADRYEYEILPAELLERTLELVPALRAVGVDRLRVAEGQWLFRRR
jgi:SAM-dependent methyltransferase